jgi:hypothetical protein
MNRCCECNDPIESGGITVLGCGVFHATCLGAAYARFGSERNTIEREKQGLTQQLAARERELAEVRERIRSAEDALRALNQDEASGAITRIIEHLFNHGRLDLFSGSYGLNTHKTLEILVSAKAHFAAHGGGE